MALSAQLKQLLNDFAKSQIALNYSKVPPHLSNPLIGDALDAAYASKEVMIEAIYDFSTMGGAVGTLSLGKSLPAGAIVTRLLTDVTTAMTSGGVATVALEVGTDVLKAATAFNDASLTGLDAHTSGLPLKSALGGNLEFVIAGAALTAGKVRVLVAYIKP